MSDNLLADMSLDFAVSVVELCDTIKGYAALKNQFIRSGTSIGANIREATYAQSRNDFIAKLQIALKECYETEYWIELFERTHIIPSSDLGRLRHDCGAIRRILISSINTAKNNAGK